MTYSPSLQEMLFVMALVIAMAIGLIFGAP